MKKCLEKGSIGTKYEEEEEEEEEAERGQLRKRRRSEEEEMEEAEGNTSVMRSDLPPERRECQKLKEHTICLAYHTNRKVCF